MQSQEWLKTVLPIIVSVLILVVGALIRKLSNLSDRLLKLETQFAFVWDMVEKKAAEILHHEDDTFNIDHLIDRYRETGGRMSNGELQELMTALDRITRDTSATDGARTMATLWLAVIGAKHIAAKGAA